MWRWASLTLSATLAAATGSIPSGSVTSMPSANGTASSSATAPPQCPPATPKPYIEIGGTDRQFEVWPARQAAQAPQLIWNGTTTRSPTATVPPARRPPGPPRRIRGRSRAASGTASRRGRAAGPCRRWRSRSGGRSRRPAPAAAEPGPSASACGRRALRSELASSGGSAGFAAGQRSLAAPRRRRSRTSASRSRAIRVAGIAFGLSRWPRCRVQPLIRLIEVGMAQLSQSRTPRAGDRAPLCR